jgi:DNA (cytosine-5)-methyltransferase 1
LASYYNEIDPYTAQWLRNLIAKGLLPEGDVDNRSISDVRPDDLWTYNRCHFFCGIGIWPYALYAAQWPEDRVVWTGSCPCQPFSSAGRGLSFADERHLWPHFFHLIEQCRPPVVFGEQVASKDGLAWLDLVLADLEGAGYAAGAVDTCAAGFGAPHIRQRLYWVADAHDARLEGRGAMRQRTDQCTVGPHGMVSGMADATQRGRREECSDAGGLAVGDRAQGLTAGSVHGNGAGRMADADQQQRHGTGNIRPGGRPQLADGCGTDHRAGPTNGHWRDADWLGCRDGKWRPVEPGTFPLVDGAAARVGRLRAYGNTLVAPQAVEFVKAYLACRP